MSKFLNSISAIFSFLYAFWPLIPLLGIRRLFRNDRAFTFRLRQWLGGVFAVWLIWAGMWRFVLWHDRQPVMILSQQLNENAFISLGVLTGGIWLIWTILRWRKRHLMLKRIKSLDAMRSLSPEDFETLVANLFKTNGHQVARVGGNSDHGVDIIVTNNQGEKWIVQCKRYKASVGEPLVRDLYGTLLHEEAQGAYLITTGVFTQKAQDWVIGKPILLYDGEALLNLIHQAKHKSKISLKI